MSKRRCLLLPAIDNLLVSSCLIGKKCCYDGESRKNYSVIAFLKDKIFFDVCPEIALGVPRACIEIRNSCGEEVLNGAGFVVNEKAEDLTGFFIDSAYKILRLVKDKNIKYAIMKSNSPSCAVGRIYDGTFSGTLKSGDGVTAALLRREGLRLFTEKDFE
ncbi:MAG: DUF523 domain-containing protein [Candidatus Omnitrophica bacterium]|nr:DUF523 domain-containing protein [Candidatus Omnitrophota bacterium]